MLDNQQAKDPLKEDFRNFLFLIWKHLNLPPPTEVQYDIGSYLQHGPKRLVIEAFRGVGKSWITSAFVCWVLYCDPQTKILVVSASKERADAFSTFTKRLITEVPFLQHLAPKGEQRSSNVAFDVGPSGASHAPSVKSVGITGQITGSRANLIVADDIETPKNSMTSVMREKLAEAIKEFDAVLSPGGRIVYLGTPQTEESIYNLLPERGYEIRIWPARYPENPDKYEGRIAPFIVERLSRFPVGSSVDPKRFSDLDLMEREGSYGRSGFALQFMLDTSMSDADRHPLKLSDLIVLSLNPEVAPVKVVYASGKDQILDLPAVGFTGDRYHSPMWVHKDWVEYQGSVMSIDPSGRGGDETGYAVVKMLNGQLYLTAAGGLKGGYELNTLEQLAKIARDQKVNYILIESNFGKHQHCRSKSYLIQGNSLRDNPEPSSMAQCH